jgi:hypothetical protein
MCELDLRRFHAGFRFVMNAFKAVRLASSQFRRSRAIMEPSTL